MNIAILHYHLRRGGVTRVVETTVNALGDDVQVAILSAAPPAQPGAFSCPVGIVDGLGYDAPDPIQTPRQLADALLSTARELLGADPDVWHVHNHSLGKNVSLPGALKILAQEGHPLLLHLHDFPEDGRSGNYLHLRDHIPSLDHTLYPAGSHVHYAALNDRDASFLVAAGSPPERTHLLPNPIALSDTPGRDPDLPRLFVYPTRAIRRKNLGEFLLWAALARNDDRFAVTLAPENPAERPRYDTWVQFATDLDLPVEFELGVHSPLPFPELMQTATALVTTSVAEGFGLAYLEPWILDRPVVGRNLPDVTAGFAANGIELGPLYDRLEVPTEWVGQERLRKALAEELTKARTVYGRETEPRHVDAAYASIARGDTVDFGRLDEAMQRDVIRHLRESPEERTAMVPNEFHLGADIAHNRSAIEKIYSPAHYAADLEALYRSLASSPVDSVQALSTQSLLDSFLDPTRFCLLRT